jgi:DNA modification methylase
MVQTRIAYKNIDFNFIEVNQSLLNIADKKRSNLFAWNGQFSPQFVETLLDNFAIKGFTVADPFVGSGTVLHECARRGLSAKGVELNPSAYYMAKLYEFCNTAHDERNQIVRQINDIINSACVTNFPLKKICSEIESNDNVQVKNTLALIIILLDLFNNDFSVDLLTRKWCKIIEIISILPETPNEITAYLGDARSFPIASDTVDLIITSPPYINVFNYHQKYRRSVEVLGYDVLKIARKEIGSNRKNRGNRLLTVIQYCVDMALAIREMVRICKRDSRIILVVGRESNVLSTSFCNSQLIYDIAHEIFDLPLILKQQRVFKNRYGQDIYEDILHFHNNDIEKKVKSLKNIREQAQQIALNALRFTVQTEQISDELLPYFSSAIEKAEHIFESEGLQ